MGKPYIGVNNVAKAIKKIYIGVNGVAKEVKKAYIGVNGVAKEIYKSGFPIISGTFSTVLTQSDWVLLGHVPQSQIDSVIAQGATNLTVTLNCNFTVSTAQGIAWNLSAHARQGRPNEGPESPYRIAYGSGTIDNPPVGSPVLRSVSGTRALNTLTDGVYFYVQDYETSMSNVAVDGNYEITFT